MSAVPVPPPAPEIPSDTDPLETQAFGHRSPAHGDQHRIGREDLAGAGIALDLEPTALEPHRPGPGADRHAALGQTELDRASERCVAG